MKVLFRKSIIAALVFVGVFFATGSAQAKDVNNFYFDDFTADYYLSMDSEGVSHLRVVENLTAVFPVYNQNKGICRQIANTNQDGKNVTLPSLKKSDIKLLRNGKTEPIYSIEKMADGFEVCTGDETYVLGRQVYTLEYTFSKVVTSFDAADSKVGYAHQELYWDTNGTGWKQKFNNVTARVHFEDESINKAYTGKKWCYVGKYGEGGSNRCTITEEDGVLTFTASNLSVGENLTFDIEIKDGTFVVPEPEVSYLLVVLAIIYVALCLLSLLIPYKSYKKMAEKRKFYKGYFIVPEYQPHKQYNLPEMAKIYLGSVKDVRAALLLEMVVKKKIELIKTKDNKIFHDEWAVKVLDKSAMDKNEEIIIKILNGGKSFDTGDQIDIKKHSPTSSMVSLGRSFDTETVSNLRLDGLAEEKAKPINLTTSSTIAYAIIAVMITFWLAPMAFTICFSISEFLGHDKIMIGSEYIHYIVAGVTLLTCGAWCAMYANSSKYKYRTIRGLEMSRYMDGLKLYIGMAEAERIKFFQSKEKAEMTPEGIVKLYEKLLPYAALFGLEKSWMKELDRYYANLDVSAQPDWYRSGVRMSDIVFASAFFSSVATSSTSISSSGGSSSGHSGGGGGGFSGGGGGGGGGGGR